MQFFNLAERGGAGVSQSSESTGWWHSDWLTTLAIGVSLLLIGALITVTGGPPNALAHFMYAPVILAAFRFGARCAFLTGVLAGVIAGPLASWLVAGDELFTAANIAGWVVRDAWFAGVGAALGIAFRYMREQHYSLNVHRYTDATTALPNLTAARRHIEKMRGVVGQGRDVLVMALRMLNYGQLVSTLGHEQADLAMAALAQRLRSTMPKGTFIGRTGPGTVTIIDWIARGERTEKYAARLRGIDRDPVPAGDVSVHIDTALGVVRIEAENANVGTMFAQAEVAAARAYDSNSWYKHYDPAEDEQRRDSIRLVGDVQRAMDDGELFLVFQPKLDLASGEISGLEALARWHHPHRGPISPGMFIPLVEQTKAIDSFSKWVLREAIRQIALWNSEGHNTAVAVNISTRNLTSGSLLRYVEEQLQAHSAAPENLELEITETALMNVSAARLDLLVELRKKGVKIALDDFGTGYTSLAHLRDLPIDILKLDRSFIRAAPGQGADLRMVKRIIQIAKDLGLEVVGEGVEDEATLRALRDLGCDRAQGFYIAKPMVAGEVAPLLSEGWQSPATGRQTQ